MSEQAELGDTIEIDLGEDKICQGIVSVRLTTPDSVVIANHMLAEEEGWRLIKNEILPIQ